MLRSVMVFVVSAVAREKGACQCAVGSGRGDDVAVVPLFEPTAQFHYLLTGEEH